MFLLDEPPISASLTSDEIQLLKRVYDFIADEPWITSQSDRLDDLALFILEMYDRGFREEKRLRSLCLVAAIEKFSDPAFRSTSSKRVDF